jgi:hypothetical protein
MMDIEKRTNAYTSSFWGKLIKQYKKCAEPTQYYFWLDIISLQNIQQFTQN